MVTADEKFVGSGRVQLWTQRFGRRADPTVLLVMGTATQGVGWPDDLVEALVNSGRQVIRFDHRDTGRSDSVDFAEHPYSLADMAADTVAVLDGYDVTAAHLVGISLGGAIGQWLAVHQAARVHTLTLMASSPMGNNPGPAWARAVAGKPASAGELPPPSARFLEHLTALAKAPRTTPAQRMDADVQTWRVLNGDVLPFDESAARRFVEQCYARASNIAAASNHDLAGRRSDDDRRASLSAITAPTLVMHGSDDRCFPRLTAKRSRRRSRRRGWRSCLAWATTRFSRQGSPSGSPTRSSVTRSDLELPGRLSACGLIASCGSTSIRWIRCS